MIGNLIALLQLGGTVVFGRLIVDKLLEKTGWLWQLTVGMIVISQTAYLVSFFPDYFWILKLMAWGLVFGGCILIGQLFFHKISNYEVLWPKNITAWLAALLSLSYLLLALGPPTQADALDYHWGVPMYLMRHYHWPPTDIWLHGSLAGIGEMYILLGMLLHAENLSTLLQAVSIVGFAHFVSSQQPSQKSEFIKLFILGVPVLLFLVSGPKPQLFPQVVTALALFLLLEKKEISQKRYALIILLLCGAAQQKLSFVLTGGLVGLWASYRHLPSHPKSFLWGFLLVVIFFLPRAWWNIQQVSEPSWLSWLTPLPTEFTNALRSYREQDWWFPFNLIFPDSFGSTSAVIGGSFFVVAAFSTSNPIWWRVNLLCLVAMILNYLLGQSVARSFYEFVLWFAIGMALCENYELWKKNITKFLLGLQSSAVLVMAVLGVWTLLPGIFSTKLRDTVLQKSANDYQAIDWSNSIIPEESYVASELRSVSLIKHNFLPTDWKRNQLSNEKFQSEFEKVDFIISKSKTSPHPLFQLKDSKQNFRLATRNPFNSGLPYSLYIYEKK